MTCSKVPQGGIEPWWAAARTQSIYMGRPLYQCPYSKYMYLLAGIPHFIVAYFVTSPMCKGLKP